MSKTQDSQDALNERRLYRLLKKLTDEFEIGEGKVLLRKVETGSDQETSRRDLLARRLGKVIMQMPDLLAQMSHARFAEYVPAIRALAEVARPLNYGDGDLSLGTTTRDALSRVKAAEKEPWTVDWIEGSMGAGETFFDIGANVGAYSLIAARAAGPSLQVFAFEPSFSNYAALVDNIARNGLSDQVNAFPVVLTRSVSLVSFQYLGLSAGAAQHAVNSRPLTGVERAPVDPVMIQQLPGFSLDGFCEQFRLPSPTHAKIDVDGHEIAVLEGGQRTLADPSLKSLLIETEGQVVLEESQSFLETKASLTLDQRWDKPGVTYSLYRRA